MRERGCIRSDGDGFDALTAFSEFGNAIAGQVRMDLEPGRIGFMSTQRRENRWQRSSSTKRAAVLEKSFPAPVVPLLRVFADGGTAPPLLGAHFHSSDERQSPGASEWLAKNSLHLGYRIFQMVRQDVRRGSPPPGAGQNAATSSPTSHGSSLPHIPSPTGMERFHRLCGVFSLMGGSPRPDGRAGPARVALNRTICSNSQARLHLSLSQDPAGFGRRAERYDGKRDLYLQHAARNAAGNS